MQERDVSPAPVSSPDHTFLLGEGEWRVSGEYIDEQGVPIQVQGSSSVIHYEDAWVNECIMELMPDNRGDYRNLEYKTIYEYRPLASNRDCTPWTASNPSLGKLHGELVVADNVLLSIYQSTNGNVRGSETLIKVSDRQYQCRGALIEGSRKSSSWILTYNRK